MIFVVGVFKLDFKNLLFGCHDFAHSGFKVAHALSRFRFVRIPDLKLQVLTLLEPVLHFNGGEVRVHIIFDFFGSGTFNPVFGFLLSG
jgi:hypothetical protein